MATAKEKLTENVKRELPFTIETMKGFNKIADAVKYFSDRRTPIRRKAIVNLFNEAHELNFGGVSLNMAVFKTDKEALDKFFDKKKLFSSELSRERFDAKVNKWFGKTDGPIKPPREVLVKDDVTSEKDAQSANSTPEQ